MVIMTEKSRKFLERELPDVVNAENYQDILFPLYNLIMDKGFVGHWEHYNDFGEEAQRVYDDVCFSNRKPRKKEG